MCQTVIMKEWWLKGKLIIGLAKSMQILLLCNIISSSFFLSEHNFYLKKYKENKRHCLRIVFIFIDLQLSSLHTPRCVIINVSDFLFYVSVKVKSNLMKCESIFISLVKQRQLFILIMESIFCGILLFIVCMFLYFESFLFQLSLF